MDKQFKELVAKLTMLGNKIEVINDITILATCILGGKVKIIVRENGITTASDEYDSVENVMKSNYYIIRQRKRYGLVYKAGEIQTGAHYIFISKGITTLDGKCKAVAKLSNGLNGVIDIHDNVIVPFNHSQIDLYKVAGEWVYIGHSLNTKKLYKENGEICKIPIITEKMDIIPCKDYVIVYDFTDGTLGDKYLVCNLNGNVLLNVTNGNIVNKGDYYQLLDNTGKVLINNINLSDKY